MTIQGSFGHFTLPSPQTVFKGALAGLAATAIMVPTPFALIGGASLGAISAISINSSGHLNFTADLLQSVAASFLFIRNPSMLLPTAGFAGFTGMMISHEEAGFGEILGNGLLRIGHVFNTFLLTEVMREQGTEDYAPIAVLFSNLSGAAISRL
jgi:hypothetical protein